MFESLSKRLQDVFKTLRGQGRLTRRERRGGAARDSPRAARSGRQLQGRQGVHRSRARSRRWARTCCAACRRRSRSSRSSATRCWRSSATPKAGCSRRRSGRASILLLGLQGAGKTTTAGKLAKWLTKQGRHPLLVSTDVQASGRDPAAERRRREGRRAGARSGRARWIRWRARRARSPKRRTSGSTSVIVDTAGRLHIDDELMDELVAIKASTEPSDLLYVADAMTGQDAIKSAGEFNRAHRRHRRRADEAGRRRARRRGAVGGRRSSACRSRSSAAASGSRISSRSTPSASCRACSAWATCCRSSRRPKRRSTSRTRRSSKRRSGANEFTLEDFRDQLQDDPEDGAARADHRDAARDGQHQGAGGEQAGREADGARRGDHQLDDAEERRKQHIINGSRRKRIAKGSGTSVEEVNRLLKQFVQMQKMLKAIGGMAGLGEGKAAR